MSRREWSRERAECESVECGSGERVELGVSEI